MRRLAIILVLIPGGCSATLETYPDRSHPVLAYQTFVRAWQDGDLEVLEASYTPSFLETLKVGEDQLGRAGLREWFRRDADKIEFGDPETERITRNLASLTVPAWIENGDTLEVIFQFDFVRQEDEWKLRGNPRRR
jgi:hypothetical protein